MTTRKDGFLSRLFGSADLVRALEAEAGGDYVLAANLYANAGDRAKVAQMHLLASERAVTPGERIEELREAARWADDDSEPARSVRRRVAGAMLSFVRARGLITDGDRGLVTEAAALYTSAGDAAGAGQCHELLGASDAAADAYQEAGEVDRLEQLLDGEAGRRRRAIAVSEALEDHRLRLRAGDPAGALSALAQAIAASEPAERPALQRGIDELGARRLPEGALRLRTHHQLVVAALAPVELGRELATPLPLRDAGISRRHARLEKSEGAWWITDLASKNGTTLGAMPVGRAVLPPRAEVGIGEHCELLVRCATDQVTLTIARGLDRGAALYVTAGDALVLPGHKAESSLRIHFADGRARVRSIAAPLRLNGVAVSAEIELLMGDTLECAGQTWEPAS